ncbi:MAG: DUF4124 domain-containing protein [Panacagrimonas sp.]
MSRLASAVVILAAAWAMPELACAEVYKCTDKDGKKIYQDRPCPQDQQSATYDPAAANLTTIDSEASRREAQEALVTREAGRAQALEAPPRRTDTEPDYGPVPVYQPEPVYYPYPVYRDRDRHHHDRPRAPHRPDETPMIEPPRSGGGYVPSPPTIRDVAPRPPSASSRRDDR